MFCIQFVGDDIDQLPRDGCDIIIYKVRKVRFGPCSHNYFYYSIDGSAGQIYCIMYLFLVWNQSYPNMCKVWHYSNGHFSRSERFNVDLCDLFGLISQKRWVLWPMLLWNTYTNSEIIFQFTLRWPLKVK